MSDSLYENHHDGPTLPARDDEEFPSAPVWDEKDLTDDEIERWVDSNDGGSRVQVVYTVPLLVEVDLLTGRVTRVREVNEDIEIVEPLEIYANPDTLAPVLDERVAKLALNIAEDTEWPSREAK